MSVAILLVLPVFLSGYIFATNALYFKYKLMRIDGYHLYFTSAKFGTLIVAATAFIYIVLKEISPEYLIILVKISQSLFHSAFGINGDSHVFPLVVIGLGSMLGARCISVLVNKFKGPYASFENAIKSDEFELLLYEAGKKKIPASFSMDNGKVYIGVIMNSYNAEEDRKYFSIIPIKSGFRDEVSKQVTFNTFYEEIINSAVLDVLKDHNVRNSNPGILFKLIEGLLSALKHISALRAWSLKNLRQLRSMSKMISIREKIDRKCHDFEIVLPVSDLKAAHLYKEEVYQSFQKQQKKERKKLLKNNK